MHSNIHRILRWGQQLTQIKSSVYLSDAEVVKECLDEVGEADLLNVWIFSYVMDSLVTLIYFSVLHCTGPLALCKIHMWSFN